MLCTLFQQLTLDCSESVKSDESCNGDKTAMTSRALLSSGANKRPRTSTKKAKPTGKLRNSPLYSLLPLFSALFAASSAAHAKELRTCASPHPHVHDPLARPPGQLRRPQLRLRQVRPAAVRQPLGAHARALAPVGKRYVRAAPVLAQRLIGLRCAACLKLHNVQSCLTQALMANEFALA